MVIGFAIATRAFRINSPTVSTSTASVAGSLNAAAPTRAPRSGHSATLLPDGKVLMAGGMRRNQDFYKSAELFDPATGKFQSTGEMNQKRVGHIAVLLASGKSFGRWWLGGPGRHGFGGTVRPGHRQVHSNRKNDHASRQAERQAADQRRCTHRWRREAGQ
jgi:hypothetical protein